MTSTGGGGAPRSPLAPLAAAPSLGLLVVRGGGELECAFFFYDLS